MADLPISVIVEGALANPSTPDRALLTSVFSSPEWSFIRAADVSKWPAIRACLPFAGTDAATATALDTLLSAFTTVTPALAGGASSTSAAPAPAVLPTASSLVRAMCGRVRSVKVSDGPLAVARCVSELLYAGSWAPILTLTREQMESVHTAASEHISSLYTREQRVGGAAEGRVSSLSRDTAMELFLASWAGTFKQRCLETHAVELLLARATPNLSGIETLPCGGCDGCCGVIVMDVTLFPKSGASEAAKDAIFRRTLTRLYPDLAPTA